MIRAARLFTQARLLRGRPGRGGPENPMGADEVAGALAIEAGFNDHLAKPVDTAALLQKVARLICHA